MPRALLALLADGQIHSGRKLGESLCVSRAAIHKKIKKLCEFGADIESIRGIGYRLSAQFDLLSAKDICHELDEKIKLSISDVEVCWSIPSTNSRCLDYSKTYPTKNYVCLAECQTEGRGRRGRQWVSPLGGGLYMSIAWRFNCGAGELEGLSLAVASIIAKTLEVRFGVKGTKLKWPNDILVNDKKMGGILIELVGEAAGPCTVILGIGINTCATGYAVCKIDQPWTDMIRANTSVNFSRNALCAALLNSLVPMLRNFEQTGFPPFRAEWERYDALCGQPVVVQSGIDSYFEGVAAGISASGDLLLDVNGILRAFKSGEVSLRRL